MLGQTTVGPAAASHLSAPREALPFTVPARYNPRLNTLAERINGDDELRQLWRSANVNAVERLGLGDCGEVHVRIVANAALKLLRLLREAGLTPSVVKNHRLAPDDAEVVVVLAAALHDLDLAVVAGDQPAGLSLAVLKGRELLNGLYRVRERTIILAEALHAIGAQPAGAACLTLEAGVLRLADALDMTKRGIRMPAESVHSLGGVMPVEEVTILRATTPPVQVLIRLNTLDGVAALETFLRHRLRGSGLDDKVAVAVGLANLNAARPRPLHIWDNPPAWLDRQEARR